jgi:hypothetical protein
VLGAALGTAAATRGSSLSLSLSLSLSAPASLSHGVGGGGLATRARGDGGVRARRWHAAGARWGSSRRLRR